MAEPFAVLPYALAAGGGRVDDFEAQQLVAAGLTLLQRSAPLVRALARRRSAILLPTSPAFLVALAASEGRGAVLVNPLASRVEIAHQLADAGVGAVFTTQALSPRLPADVPRVLLDDAPRSATVIADGVPRTIDLGSHFGLDLEGDADAAGSDEEAVVVYTSAMAGTPLGARLSHRNLLSNARATVVAAHDHADDHLLALLPWSHLFGLTVTAAAPLLVGARITTAERFHPIKTVELLAGGTITQLIAVPAVFRALLTVFERHGGRLDTGALRLALCGGAALPRELQERWEETTGIELRQGYGLTEAGPVCLVSAVGTRNVPGSLGKPIPGVEIAVARPLGDGETPSGSPAFLPAGEEGELLVRGQNVFMGYVSRSDDGLCMHDGWLRTGDLVVRDADGVVWFRGVTKPMFTHNGFNIYPREIERAVRELEGVERVVVRAVPDPAKEHLLVLEVSGRVTAEDVKQWCERRLAAYKQPAEIRLVGR